MDKRFMAILVGLIIILGGIFLISQKSSDNNQNSGSASGQPTNHVIGKGKKVRLIEYGDYQCPACHAYEPVMERIRATYGKQITFQFRNLPLIALHPNAFSAARAAEAADLQKKFWQMHDLLYKNENYQTWITASNPLSLFEGYAQQLHLKTDKFKSDYSSGVVNDRINADLDAFKKTNQEQATPAFFLDGQYISPENLPNPQVDPNATFSKFSAIIKAEIKEKGQ